jgi:hypothetical protein
LVDYIIHGTERRGEQQQIVGMMPSHNAAAIKSKKKD